MEQNFETIKEQLENLEADVKARITDEVNERHPIYDGAISIDDYLKSDKKILWLLKEAYDEKDGKGGGWSYSGVFRDNQTKFVQDYVFGQPKPTWEQIVLISNSILNNETTTNVDDLKKIKSIPTILEKIAIVNIQKLPSLNGPYTSMSHIKKAFSLYSDLIISQIDLLNPDVVICGNVYDIIKSTHESTDSKQYGGCAFYQTKDRIFIDAFHPGQRKNREQYNIDVINAIKDNLK